MLFRVSGSVFANQRVDLCFCTCIASLPGGGFEPGGSAGWLWARYFTFSVRRTRSPNSLRTQFTGQSVGCGKTADAVQAVGHGSVIDGILNCQALLVGFIFLLPQVPRVGMEVVAGRLLLPEQWK